MTTMTNPNANGRRRPSLGEQINRLDNMLDGLSEGLNDAIADAVKNAVASAVNESVQAVLTEVLTNPEILARLQPAFTPAAPAPMPAPPVEPRIISRDKLRQIWSAIRNGIAHLQEACGERVRRMRTSAANFMYEAVERTFGVWALCQKLKPFKYQIVFALGVGMTIGFGVLHAGPFLGAVTSGVGAFATALSIQVGLWLRKLFLGDAQETA